MPDLIKNGNLYVSRPPLFAVYTKNKGKTDVEYFWSYEDAQKYMNKLKHSNVTLKRFKGLGEMDADELSETCLHPETRSLYRVTAEDCQRVNEVISALMGDDSNKRKIFLQTGEV